jgi:ribonuclease P protein component
LGLAISKRYARRAIDRNRLKRIARESFRTNRHRLPAVDIIVLCDRRASTLSNECLFSALMNAWKALGSTAWQGS